MGPLLANDEIESNLRRAADSRLEGGRQSSSLARHAHPKATEHYDRARRNLDRHGVHFLTAYVSGV